MLKRHDAIREKATDERGHCRDTQIAGLAIVEVTVRAAITRHHLAWKPDPFLYKNAANLPGLKEKAYEKLMAHISDAVAKSKSEPFMRHLVKVADSSSPWLDDIASVVTGATPFMLRGMGFPSDWQTLALWQ